MHGIPLTAKHFTSLVHLTLLTALWGLAVISSLHPGEWIQKSWATCLRSHSKAMYPIPLLSLPHLMGLSTLLGASWPLICSSGPGNSLVVFAVCFDPARRPHWLRAVRGCVEQREVAAEGTHGCSWHPLLLTHHICWLPQTRHLQPSARLPGGAKSGMWLP